MPTDTGTLMSPSGRSRTLTGANKLARDGIQHFAQCLRQYGFESDSSYPSFLAPAETTADVGSGCVYLSSAVDSSPPLWLASPRFGWRLPEVDAVRRVALGDDHVIDPTISESVFSSVEPGSRDHYTRPTEFAPDSDPLPRLEAWANTANQQWSWWSGQFTSLDDIFEYLRRRELGKFSNFDTGLILALLHDRPELAARFARLPFSYMRAYWASEKKYAMIVGDQRAFAAAVGVAAPDLPTFAQLNSALTSLTDDDWPVLSHPIFRA